MTLKERLISVREEITTFKFWKAVRCEFLISLLYVFIGCGSITFRGQNSADVTLLAALTFGLGEATFVQCVGHISGAHLNPAISIAMLVTRNISPIRAMGYVVAQCLGAMAGAGILYGLVPEENQGSLGVTHVNNNLGKGQAFGIEFMITFILVFTFFANLEQKRTEMGSRSLSIGLSVTLGHLFAFPYTGASMNPARSLGPAVVMHDWAAHWVYWVGPVLGGILGGFTYEYTQDSVKQIQNFKRSFRQKATNLRRSQSNISDNTMCTELTFSHVSPHTEEPQVCHQ